MIKQIYLVEYGSYSGYASTYEKALELEKRYEYEAISITADEIREYRKNRYKPTVLKSDNCSSAMCKETVTNGVTSLFENGKHKATILNCEDLSVSHNIK